MSTPLPHEYFKREKSAYMACLHGCDFSLALVALLQWGSPLGWCLNSLISKAHYRHADKGHHYPPETFLQFLLWVRQTSSSQ